MQTVAGRKVFYKCTYLYFSVRVSRDISSEMIWINFLRLERSDVVLLLRKNAEIMHFPGNVFIEVKDFEIFVWFTSL